MLIVWGWPKPCSRVCKYSRWWQLKYFFVVIPIWGRFPFWGLHIFQMGWFNHQLVIYYSQYEANPLDNLQIHCKPLFRQGPNMWNLHLGFLVFGNFSASEGNQVVVSFTCSCSLVDHNLTCFNSTTITTTTKITLQRGILLIFVSFNNQQNAQIAKKLQKRTTRSTKWPPISLQIWELWVPNTWLKRSGFHWGYFAPFRDGVPRCKIDSPARTVKALMREHST